MESFNFIKLQEQITQLLKKNLESAENSEKFKIDFDKIKEVEENSKKTALEQAYRELIITDYIDDVSSITNLLKLSIETCKAELCSFTLPVILLADVFEVVTLDKCEELFTFVEENVSVFKEEVFFAPCKNHLLRMSNDLLRKLSRSQNTVFCGRILLFLAKFFPFSERSGLNIVSEFNIDNVTEYGADNNLELTDSLGDTEENQLKIDYNLYCKFWSLQEFFRCPYTCYDKTNWKKFTSHTDQVLSAFSSFKLEENEAKSTAPKSKEELKSDANNMEVDKEVEESHHFFAKFLTNPKLLALQLSDSNFRRSILVQYLILFNYLNSTVKFKTESETLTASQTEWITEREVQIYKLLEETPPNGKKFLSAIKHILKREELWNNWKNDGCKEITRPDPNNKTSPPPAKRPKKLLGDLINDSNKQGKFYMGSTELTRLWNLCPDNLQACKGADRNFLPSLDSYLDNPKEKTDPSFEWRALRLLARQSPHFFSMSNTASCKVSDLLEIVHKKIQKDKNELKPETEEMITTDQLESEPIEEDMDEQDQLTPEEKNTHKTVNASQEQVLEISNLVGADWRKLGLKLGYSKDVLDYYESETSVVAEQCRKMLSIWFEEDEDNNLDNLAYTLEGLEILKAAELIKEILGADKAEEISE